MNVPNSVFVIFVICVISILTIKACVAKDQPEVLNYNDTTSTTKEK